MAQALVWPVVIEMADVLIKNSVGVSRMVNQHPVGAFGADAVDEPFRVAVRPGVRGGILTMSMPSEVKMASRAAVNFASRSRISKRKVLTRSPRPIRRLRAAWMVQSAVG